MVHRQNLLLIIHWEDTILAIRENLGVKFKVKPENRIFRMRKERERQRGRGREKGGDEKEK